MIVDSTTNEYSEDLETRNSKHQQAAYELSTVNITFSNSVFTTNETSIQVKSTYIFKII